MISDDERLVNLLPFLPKFDQDSWETRLLYFFSLESFGGDGSARTKATQLVEMQRYWEGKVLTLGDRIPDDVTVTIPDHLEGMKRDDVHKPDREWFGLGVEQWSLASYMGAREAPVGTPTALGVSTYERFDPVKYSCNFLLHDDQYDRREVHLPWVKSFMREIDPYPELNGTTFEKLIDKRFRPALLALVEISVRKIILGEEPGDEKFWLDLYVNGTPYMGFADENIGRASHEPKVPADLPKFLYK